MNPWILEFVPDFLDQQLCLYLLPSEMIGEKPNRVRWKGIMHGEHVPFPQLLEFGVFGPGRNRNLIW